ncbi:MAG: hypothetical protein JWM12_914 [Ilumatobacteraceae bacterium]|nr:hypothetical protein [Ilumatobacteraceae bacterium]
MRVLTAAAILVGGLVHLDLYFRYGYRSFPPNIAQPNLGRSFLTNGVASIVLAAALLVRRDVILRLAALGLVAGTLAAFVMSRNLAKGIFMFSEHGFEPSPQAALTLVAEIVALVLLLASFVPALSWKRQPVISMAVGGLLAIVVVAVGIGISAKWAHTDSTTASAPGVTYGGTTPTTAAGPGAPVTTGGPATTTASGTAAAGTPAAGGDAVSIKDFSFQPDPLSIPAGSAVTWTNADGTTHNIQSADHTFDSPDNLATGDSFTHTFATAGTFTFICGIHPQMNGTVVVTG